jgi:hypothetical protein
MISLGDTQQQTVSVESLGSGQLTNKSVQFNTAQNAGQYWLGACVLAVEKEARTSNNCSLGVSISWKKNLSGKFLILFDDEQ